MPTTKAEYERQIQRAKLANSYQQLLDEFSSKDLQSVGNYTLGRLIGKGSFGKVYLATHKLTNGSKVVLKSANKEDGNLAREIHHHRQFLHPHIARLYEVIVTEKLVWLVLEYCPGDELYSYLLRNGPLPVRKAQRVFTQLVGAVSYVHKKSCVHRDLKLENILLDKHENVKLCDFGFTREYEGKSNYLQTFCGTVCYSAPEMLKGEKYAGEKVDIWSLGIILYALLAGELPWDEDNDNETKIKILNTEPNYPQTFPSDAVDLIKKLLSKRPLFRPSLCDILNHPFLAEFAPQQQAILNLQQPAPFTTQLEKDVLQRMRSAGVNIDQVIENVLAQRCDPLAGWWALLLEKEQRKEKRREKKRKEKDVDVKSRRLSAASNRMDRKTSGPANGNEGINGELNSTPVTRGRRKRRSVPTTPSIVVAGDFPRMPERAFVASPQSDVPPPIDKDSIRSASSSRHRPPLPPKERRVSRGSMLQMVTSNAELLSPVPQHTTKNRHGQRTILNQLASIKQWFVDNAKRARSPNAKSQSFSHPPGSSHCFSSGNSRHTISSHRPNTRSPSRPLSSTNIPPRRRSSANTLTPNTPTFPGRAPNSRQGYVNASHRSSLSPAPRTPHASYRRTSANLRGRKSTSSSLSSIRSIHHAHTHSKASSTSSNSIHTAHSSIYGTRPTSIGRSPHSSVKVLPATPTTTSFPSSVRLVRSPPVSTYNEAAFFNSGPLSSPVVFARRKRSPFKGPVLHVATSNLSSATSSGNNGFGSRARAGSASSRSNAASTGRQSGEVIVEEEEGEEEEEDVEEVDAFSPVDVGEEVSFEPSSRDEMISRGKLKM